MEVNLHTELFSKLFFLREQSSQQVTLIRSSLENFGCQAGNKGIISIPVRKVGQAVVFIYRMS